MQYDRFSVGILSMAVEAPVKYFHASTFQTIYIYIPCISHYIAQTHGRHWKYGTTIVWDMQRVGERKKTSNISLHDKWIKLEIETTHRITPHAFETEESLPGLVQACVSRLFATALRPDEWFLVSSNRVKLQINSTTGATKTLFCARRRQ